MTNQKIVSMESRLPHTVTEVMCVMCKKRWIDAFPSDVWLKDLECPYCGNFGMIIATGQELEAAKK